jgi:hypothetical protein
MAQKLDLRDLMSRPVVLGKDYHLTPRRARRLHNLINQTIFQGKLSTCDIAIRPMKKVWGWCLGFQENDQFHCRIELPPSWPFPQYAITVLAHEMCHQYQWEIVTPRRIRQGQTYIMSHGPSFFHWRDRLNRHFIPLHESMYHPVIFFEKYLVS